jgi:hypothetical protein
MSGFLNVGPRGQQGIQGPAGVYTNLQTITFTATSGHTTYAVDSGSTPDYQILINGDGYSVNITMPAPTLGRMLFIKDISGTLEEKSLTITIHPHGSEKFDGQNQISWGTPDYFGVTLTSDGANWFIVNCFPGLPG